MITSLLNQKRFFCIIKLVIKLLRVPERSSMAFWTDETVSEILKRKDKKYLITDYKTPSGRIHVGALRGVVIHDLLYKGLLDSGVKTEYWYGFDDFDPIDDLADNLKKDFEKYMGVPLCNTPSPVKGYKNFAEYYAKDFIQVYEKLGVRAKTIWASRLYKEGKYNKAIKIVLDNAEKIRNINKKVSGGKKSDDWFPLQVVCPKCGKIGTTKVTGWNSKEVEFSCEPKMVEWAQGCRYKGKISPFNGNAKMPYKPETTAKWYTFKTSVELAGKDHYTQGGSFNVAQEIAKQVFNIKPAYGYGYEWFLVGGKKMSTSKGRGVSSEEIAELLPPEILRFLMVRTKAKRAIDFAVYGDTIPILYDEYDRCIDAYLKDSTSDLARAYYYSRMKEARPPSYRLRFSKAVYLIQMHRTDVNKYAEEEKGSKLDKIEKEELDVRVKYAKKWLEKYAPENYKFTIQKELPQVAKNLDQNQKKFLLEIVKLLEQKKWAGEELHKQIHELKKNLKLDPRSAFSAIYLSLLGKDSGPQAGWLLAALDGKFIIQRFQEIQ